MAFGRMNPPTIGHAKLVDAIKSQPGDPYLFLSQSQKPKTDPLAFEDKLRYAKFFFPNITIGNPEVKTIIQALQKIEQLGYKNLIYVAGSDRVASFEELINKYNGKDYNFDTIQVVSAGERDPDADGAEGMSASKMRQAAADNDIEMFKQGVPNQELADELFVAVRAGMGIAENEKDKYNKVVLTPHQNLPNPDTPFGGTTMVTKSFRDLQKAQKKTQTAVDQRQGAGMSRVAKFKKIDKTDFSPEVFPRRNKPKAPRT